MDDESINIQLRKPARDSLDSIKYTFLTNRRAKKLELLIHLLTNSPQGIVICGSDGIGKSTLLRFLTERKDNFWIYCRLFGKADLSFDIIQEQLLHALKDQKLDINADSLKTMLDQIERQNKKVVLLIDDAGNLEPGLIATIIRHYASSKPILRVVFVLTHDEMSIKISSDKVIDDCHFIEIPPLSENECGEFLRILATHSFTKFSINAINDALVETVYKETHGIPGKIIEQLPVIALKTKKRKSWRLILLILLAVCAIAFGFQGRNVFEYLELLLIKPVQSEQKTVSTQLTLP
jgi:DamX protein